jgi:hypothetical protein
MKDMDKNAPGMLPNFGGRGGGKKKCVPGWRIKKLTAGSVSVITLWHSRLVETYL